MKIAVVGSGLAATSCAQALADRGADIVILDVGDTLGSEQQAVVDELKRTPPGTWDREKVAAVRGTAASWSNGIPVKLAFGSNYPYGIDRDYFPLDAPRDVLPPSFAKGGYSTVWGGAMLPYRDEDITSWPIAAADLEPYYRAVLSYVPMTGEDDALARAFPSLKEKTASLRVNGQMRRLRSDIARAASQLADQNIFAGAARLAVWTLDQDEATGCVDCGLCLTGCPRGAIFSAESLLDRLIARGVHYAPGKIVRTVRETGDGVDVTYVEANSGRLETGHFDRVFLGAGTLSTTRIMLESLRLYDHEVTVCETQKFIIPWVRFAGDATFFEESAGELAGMFIELKEPETDGRWFHLQISPNNYLALRRLGLERENLGPVARRLVGPFMGRLVFVWGGMHSDYSARLTVRLVTSTTWKDGGLRIATKSNPERRRKLQRLGRILLRNWLLFRALPIMPAAMLAPPGSGHLGGTFPMRRVPERATETDALGRPKGHSRVHLVDASVFPSIPSSTIGLTIMANARRIASLADLG